MTVEPDDSDFEPWRGEIDPITAALNAALCPLFEVVFAHTREGEPSRRAAMNEVLAVAERIRAALAPKPRLN
jgi:hypothetical protein